ncbi:hypothetical protein BUALT_Bualt05G0074400 [Buddleja alternifolia]|uniref:Transposase n=1 Tax=Buddleja alternifolia TaxID=168488 RepID=A0AAV6XTR3_9LAMI|nr:hypothetical protein BUALT_Bualt05G0074400 [Buddleja alternifolia]
MVFYRFYRGRRKPHRCAQVLTMPTYSMKFKIQKQLEHMHDLVSLNDETCIDNLRMSRNALGRLCYKLENVGGLENTKNVTVSEQVAIFLTVLAHHKKNCIVKHDFKRSGYTISKHFNSVLSALLKLYNLFLVKPTPIEDDTTNERWKWFKGCLGALDVTDIPLRVAKTDKPRYRNRKGDVSVNVLVVCDINMNYVYMLCGWEGFAADSRVLRDAITRENDFRIPDDIYMWVDGQYCAVQNRIIMACALPHNFIRIEMPVDPLEAEFPKVDDEISDDHNSTFIDQVEPSQHWSNWRESLATNMFDEWRGTLMAASSGRIRGGAANLGNGKSTRRCWTPDEEKVLANALKDLLARGYKADNGFKSGYQMLLEQAMVQAFPETNIRADPHINSRITVWRKNYATISTLQSRSGFGWNDAINRITVESEDAWNNFVKTDSKARNMRYKTWPLYKDWVEIFGKDRATSEGAKGFADVRGLKILQMLFKSNNPQVDECQSMSFSNANHGGSNKSSDKRKRKVVDENDDRFIDPMTSFCDKTNERLGDISRRIGFEHDASLSRKVVYEALGDLGSSLDMEGMILVSHLIVNNTKNMDLFFNLPIDGRKTMVHMILEGKFPGMGGY